MFGCSTRRRERAARPRRFRPGAARKAGEAGFTLIEVLVAFTIMAIAVAALLQAFTSGLRSGRVAEARSQLVARAEGRLAQVGRDIPLAPGTYGGTTVEDGDWSIEIRTVEPADGGGGVQNVTMYDVRVVVTAAEGMRQELSTMRLGPSP